MNEFTFDYEIDDIKGALKLTVAPGNAEAFAAFCETEKISSLKNEELIAVIFNKAQRFLSRAENFIGRLNNFPDGTPAIHEWSATGWKKSYCTNGLLNDPAPGKPAVEGETFGKKIYMHAINGMPCDLPDGTPAFQLFYPDGSKAVVGQRNDQAQHHGVWNFYREDGTIEKSDLYKNDVRIEEREFWLDGTLKEVVRYNDLGKAHGNQEIYSKEGQLEKIITFDDGKMVQYKGFHSDGSLKELAFYKDDLLVKPEGQAFASYAYDTAGRLTFAAHSSEKLATAEELDNFNAAKESKQTLTGCLAQKGTTANTTKRLTWKI